MNVSFKFFQFLLIALLVTNIGFSQTCPVSSINAQAGTGPSTTICSGKCATLTSSVVAINTTSSYSVAANTYAPYSYTIGTLTSVNVDDVWSPALNIGFNFCYFGNSFTQLRMGSNGEITFNVPPGGEFYTVTSILPNLAEHPGNTICGPYRDIDPSVGVGSNLTYTTIGVAPCRIFIANWSNVPLYSVACNSLISTFQIILYEKSNIIDVNIQNSPECPSFNNGRGLIGIQNGTGTVAFFPPGRNVLTPWSATNESWRFTPTGAPSYSVTWNGPGGYTSTGLSATPCPTTTSTYTATMNESNCGGGTTSYTSSVQVVVLPSPTITASSSSASICVGSSATLTGFGGTTYTWNPGGLTGTSITVSPASTTIYTVTGLLGSCTNTGTVSVSVLSGPLITATSSPSVICVGNSSTLSGIGATSYTWNPGALVGSSVSVSPLVSTVYTVTGVNALGCPSTKTLSVIVSNPTLTITSNPAILCPGNIAALIGSGAVTYTWFPGGLTGSAIGVAPVSTTIYTVTGTTSLGCPASGTLNLVVSPIPIVTASSSPTAICLGSPATLTGFGALTYTWNPGGLTGTSVTVSPIANTIYTVTGKNAAGCPNTNTISLVVNPLPTITVTASPILICIGNSSTLTATGATSYTWSPGGSTSNPLVVTPTVTTTYTVTGINAFGCTNIRTRPVIVSNPTLTAVASSNTLCAGSSATLTAGGLSTYTWTPGPLTGASITVTPSSSTVYTVTASTPLGCTSTKTISISVIPNPTVTASSSPSSICLGNTATLSAFGAASYTWNPGGLTGSPVSVSPLSTTVYTVIGRNASGCSHTTTLSLTVNPLPLVTATSSPTLICIGSSATLSGLGAASYTWNPGGSTINPLVVSPTVTTTYTVTGISGLGCLNTNTVSVSVSNPSVLITASSPTICLGSSVTLTGSGASTYTWNPGGSIGTTVTVSPVASTIYTLSGTTALGCVATKTINITVIGNPTVIASSSPTAICLGSTATLTALGGTSYTWNPGGLTASTITVSPLANTVYTVTGLNASGCSNSTTLSLVVNPVPSITVTASPILICIGNSSTLTATGAASYTWNPGGSTSNPVVVTPTVTTTYTVTGINAFGCTSIRTRPVIVSNPTLTAVASSNTLCAGSSVTLTAGGFSTYTWTPGPLTGASITVTPLSSTVYTVTASTPLGCTSTKTINISVIANPTVIASSSSTAICVGSTATLTALGGTSYTWSPGGLTVSTITVNPTSTTVYTLTGSNVSGCTNTTTLSLTVNANPTVTASSNPSVLCIGTTATLTALGGTSYTWSPGGLTAGTITVSPSSSTIYTVTGVNASGCTNTTTLSLSVSDPTLSLSSSSNTICAGTSATLTASGLSTYTWNPGGLTGSTVVVSPSVTITYTAVGTSSLGCTSTKTISISVIANPTVIASSSSTAICVGSTATLTALGGTSYTWSPGGLTVSTITVNPTSTTVYTLTGSNVSGCTNTTTLSLTVNANPTVTASSNPSVLCIGTTATLTALGGTSYTWSPGGLTAGTITVSPSSSTIYTVTGVNASGCTNTTTLSLSVSDPTLSLSSSSNTICAGTSATLTASGLSTYTWNPGGLTGSTVVVSPSVTITYTAVGTSSLGCTSTKTISISVIANPTITASSSSTAICVGSTATLTALGGTSYTWSPGGLTVSTITVNPTSTTVYTLTGSNVSGCTNTTTLSLTVNANPTVTASSNPSVLCIGTTATLTAFGGTSYTWTPGGLTASTITVNPSSSTIYTVTGVNASGCTNTTTLSLSVSDPTLSLSSSSNTICAGTSATLTASGLSTYTWNPGVLTGTTVVVSPSVTTTYTVDANNVFGCFASTTITINVNTAPSVSVSATPTVLCGPGTVTLTGSGALTYSWSPIALTGSVVVDNISTTTTYSLIGSDAIGCSNTATLTIAVGSPTVIVVGSSSGICVGSTATLSASGASSYTWNPGGLTTSTIAVNPTSTTVYTVTGLVGTCTNTQTLNLNVSAIPTLSLTAASNTICAGTSATITASGASTYTWNPGALTGTTVVVSPTLATTYTVDGDNGFGCIGTETITINVNTAPSVSVSATPTVLCGPGTVTLTGSGALTYSWSPIGLTGSVVVDNILSTTTYSLIGSDAIGCSSTETLTIAVGSPTVSVVGSSSGICIGATATLSASGASSYTWNPGGLTTGTITVNPTSTTIYTVTGLVGTCTDTQTLNLNVSASPTISIVATSNTICAGSTLTLTGSGASTYTWNPGALTGSLVTVNPSVTTTYTVDGDNGLGCIASETVIITVNALPSLSISASPVALCAPGTVTLTGSGADTYSWIPSGTTGTVSVENPTTTTVYTLSGTDVLGCSNSQTISISVGTPTITITSTPTVLCIGSTATLTASGASTYTWSPLAIVGSTVTDSPIINTTYTVTGDNGFGCISTNTFVLSVVNCTLSTHVLGLTKAVSTATIINSNAYNVTYTIVATNPSTVNLTGFSIVDNLTSTFPLPATYSVISTPLVTSINSSLTVNSIFDGALQNDLLSPLTSTLLAGKADTIVFTVQINPNGLFGPFYNSAVGYGTDDLGVLISDSSNTGFSYDPDSDGDPTNNDTATVLTLLPFTSIGIAKSGSVSGVLLDKTLDVTYVITVKNLGNDTLKTVQVKDDLTIPLPATFTIKSGPTATGSLTANPLYDGILDSDLLIASSSSLAPGQVETITLVLNITPNAIKTITNIAVGTGTGSIAVSDTSNTGNVADPNGNDNATEQGENIPTVLSLPDVNLFIPDVFTPDGDGKNDLFVIKGISGREVKLTVFNRWGNKVYSSEAYANTWDGSSNVSGLILGTSKLPQGTYYYVAEFMDGVDKPINGYIVLQY